MPCPFGFQAEAADNDGDVELESGGDDSGPEDELAEGAPVFCAGEALEGGDQLGGEEGGEQRVQARSSSVAAAGTVPKKKSRKSKESKKKASDAKRFDFETDPVSWFYQNQIKGEEDFQARKAELRAEARKRLDAIMAKKEQQVLWPSDSEFDDISISSAELSDLDSDVHSMHSLRSCAVSWEENARFTRPAEQTAYYTAMTTLAISLWCMYMSYHAYAYTNKVFGVVLQSQWPWYAVLGAIAMSLTSGVMLLAKHYRAKKIVLVAQILAVVMYGATLFLTMQLFLQPLEVDTDLMDKACTRFSRADKGSKLCQTLPDVQVHIAQTLSQLKMSMAGLSACGILLAAVGAWYVLELCYVEKKSIKHLRRHKRNKHRIPWEKIKIEGPVTNCGVRGDANPNQNAQSKCPVMH